MRDTQESQMTLQDRIYDALTAKGVLTSDEVAILLNGNPETVSRRLRELRDEGLVESCGVRGDGRIEWQLRQGINEPSPVALNGHDAQVARDYAEAVRAPTGRRVRKLSRERTPPLRLRPGRPPDVAGKLRQEAEAAIETMIWLLENDPRGPSENSRLAVETVRDLQQMLVDGLVIDG